HQADEVGSDRVAAGIRWNEQRARYVHRPRSIAATHLHAERSDRGGQALGLELEGTMRVHARVLGVAVDLFAERERSERRRGVGRKLRRAPGETARALRPPRKPQRDFEIAEIVEREQ